MDPQNPATPTVPTTGAAPVGDSTPGVTPAANPASLTGYPLTPETPQFAVSTGSSPESALLTQHEKRINDLISKWQKSEHERDVALARNVALQKELADLRESATSSLSTAAATTQQALDQANAQAARIIELEGNLRKAETLRQHPELLAYADFIPVAGTAEEQQKVVEKLKEIRAQDLQKITNGQPPIVANPTTLPPGTPNPQQQQQAFFQLLNNRATLPPNLLAQNPLIGSTPTQLNPGGTSASATQSIEQLLSDARKSGNPAEFEKALEQAKALAATSISNQLGRG